MKVALLIASDTGARSERVDRSGPALRDWLCERGIVVERIDVVPDEAQLISERLRDWADGDTYDLVVTCGGTGVSPRDVTPEATLAVGDRLVPGIGESMRRRSLEHTPHAVLSRGEAVIRGRTLIVNLPGSPRAALQNLEAIWEALPHAIAKIHGDTTPCGEDDS